MQKLHLERFLRVLELSPNFRIGFSNFGFLIRIPSFFSSNLFHWFLTMFPCSDLFTNWYAYSFNQYLDTFFLIFRISTEIRLSPHNANSISTVFVYLNVIKHDKIFKLFGRDGCKKCFWSIRLIQRQQSLTWNLST